MNEAHSIKTKEGIKRAIASGAVLGRRPFPQSTREQILFMRRRGASFNKIAAECHVSVGLAYNVCSRYTVAICGNLMSEKELVNRISALEETVQAPVASIVYWDWFGRIRARNCPRCLDKWVKITSEDIPDVSTEKLIAGLMACGYSENEARSRAGIPTPTAPPPSRP